MRKINAIFLLNYISKVLLEFCEMSIEDSVVVPTDLLACSALFDHPLPSPYIRI